jgi:carbonic anhydrase
MEGNKRYVNDNSTCHNDVSEVRATLSRGQQPFAILVGCSDSRVPPEIVFDQGIGDLFVVRVAGNVVGPVEQDSIEYSALTFGSSIIMVLGHERCGAVQAVVDNNTADIEDVALLIRPAVKLSKNEPGDPVENAVKANVRLVVKQLRNTPVISRLIKEGRIEVVGGFYHLTNGTVDIISEGRAL